MSGYFAVLIRKEHLGFFRSQIDCRAHEFVLLPVQIGADYNGTRSSFVIERITRTDDIASVDMAGKHEIWFDRCLQDAAPFRIKWDFDIERRPAGPRERLMGDNDPEANAWRIVFRIG